jgi:hypothetical protein
MRGLVNGIGGTVMGEKYGPEWKWPDPPYTMARDVIATHCRNWGRGLAYKLADDLLVELDRAGFQVTQIVEKR